MLTEIWNIVFHYDEHRLGREESMEPRKVELSDQFCRGCHQPHKLDENKRCEFCRLALSKAITRPERHLTRFRRWLADLIAPRKGYSIIK